MNHARTLGVIAVLSLALLGGCAARGEGTEAAKAPAPASGSVAPTPTEVTSSPAPRTLHRQDVQNALRAGLGAFLQRIDFDVEHPVFERGRFKGFRVLALKDPTFWRGVDLEPGDVVTHVNGKVIERPEQALEVFYSLATAPELRVATERRGAPRELVFPID